MLGITNWQTTAMGIAAILTSAGAIFHAAGTGDWTTALSALPGILGGLGLVAAKDKNVTGGSVSNVTGLTAVAGPVSLVDDGAVKK